LREKRCRGKPGFPVDPENKGRRGSRSLVDEAGHPVYKTATVATSLLPLLLDWAQDSTGDRLRMISDAAACFRAVCRSRCFHHPVVVKRSSPNELPEFHVGLTPVLKQLETRLSAAASMALRFEKYADRLLGASATASIRRSIWPAMTAWWFMPSAAVKHAGTLLRCAEFAT